MCVSLKKQTNKKIEIMKAENTIKQTLIVVDVYKTDKSVMKASARVSVYGATEKEALDVAKEKYPKAYKFSMYIQDRDFVGNFFNK